MGKRIARKLTPAQVALFRDEAAFEEWWRKDGRYIDPDTSDVDWFDKRKELAHDAWNAAKEAAK